MALQKKKYPKGSIISYQFEDANELYILLSGKLEILASSAFYEDKKKLINESSRIAIIDTPKTPFGEISFILNQKRTASIRAQTEVICAAFKGTKEDLNNLIKTNPQIGISIALTVIKRFKKCKEIIIKANQLYKELASIFDNFSFAYYKLINSAKSSGLIKKEHTENIIYKTGLTLENRIIKAGGEPPKQLPLPLLETDLSKKFYKKYIMPPFEKSNIAIDYELALFFENLLSLNINFLNTIMSNKPYVIFYMTEKLVKYISVFNSRTLQSEKFVEKELEKLIGTEGCFNKFWTFYEQLKEAGSENLVFFDRLISILSKNLKEKSDNYIDIWGRTFPKIDKNLNAQFSLILQKEQKKEEIIQTKRKELKIQTSEFDITNHYDKILEIPYISDTAKKELKESYTNYSSLPDKFEVGGEPRKIKRLFAEKHLNFIKEIYQNFLTNETLTDNELYLIRFNILDEILLDNNMTNAFKLIDHNSKSEKYPIYYIDEWISKIYDEDDEPSISELGETYKEYLKELDKNNINSNNHKWTAAEYELTKMLASAMKTCAGSLSAQVPILDKSFVIENAENTLLNKKKLEAVIDKIMKKLFSLFYREVRVIYEDEKVDYIRKSITPNFIFIPIAGSKVICWQEIVGTNKSSRGRILVPLLPTANIEEIMLKGLGDYFWELNKTMAGYSWGDPIDGGVTGKYFDYSSIYKQSRELSEEVKEKVTELFKKHSTTRDKFTAELSLWYFNESEGIMKLNPLSREIFYNYVPLSKEYREKIKKFPVFEKLANRFNNLANKEVKLLQNKIKRLETNQLNVPKELTDALNFYEI